MAHTIAIHAFLLSAASEKSTIINFLIAIIKNVCFFSFFFLVDKSTGRRKRKRIIYNLDRSKRTLTIQPWRWKIFHFFLESHAYFTHFFSFSSWLSFKFSSAIENIFFCNNIKIDQITCSTLTRSNVLFIWISICIKLLLFLLLLLLLL